MKSNLDICVDILDSRAMSRTKRYLQVFKNKIVRKENNFKTQKFYQILHILDYVTRYGCPMNYDESRGETVGKLKTKDNAKLPNKKRMLSILISLEE